MTRGATLVVGGAGFIGSHMVRHLLLRGERVLVLDNLSTGHRDAVPAAVPFFFGDIRDAAFLDDLFGSQEIGAVMHFAALASVGQSMKRPDLYYDNNVVGSLRLLEAMRKHQVGQFIFSSTAAVYGEPREIPIVETHPRSPTNPYGETKKAVEEMLAWYGTAYGMSAIALRYFNAAGADPDGLLGERHLPEEHLIPVVLEAAFGLRPPLRVFGTHWPTPDGTCVRDYVHVTDLCRAHYLALDRLRCDQAPAGAFEAFNLGSESGSSVLEVIAACERVTGLGVPWMAAPPRPGDPAFLVASAAQARSELGWRTELGDLETIVADAFRWMSYSGRIPENPGIERALAFQSRHR